MSNEDKIKELFAEKLGAHEAPVNPELWNAIASQIGTSVAATSTGLSVLTKIIIGVSAASVIGVSAYFVTRDNNSKQKDIETIQHSKLATENTEADVNQDKSSDDNELNARTIYTPPTVLPLSENSNSITEENTTSSVDNSLTEQPKDVKKKDNKHSGLAETGNASANESTSNPVGEKAVPAPVAPAQPKASDKKDPKSVSNTPENTSNSIPKQEEKASFELTELPNIYGLNANGYFSIGYKGEYSDFQFTIMDNNHNVIFRSDRPDFEWRGTDLYGNQIEPGKYVYIITAKDKNGKAVNKYSSLTVINQ